MSFRQASRRLVPSGSHFSPSTAQVTRALPVTTGTAVQKRTKWSLNPFDWGSRSAPAKKTPGASSLDLDDPKTRQQFLERNREGKLEDNIFQDEIDSAKGGAATKGKGAAKGGSDVAETKTRENTAMVLDPSPKARVRWHRRKVMEMVRRNGAVTREERIRMTERELTHASPAMATSVKKLILLARQISGKTVDDAIQQMTWSKKKMAAEVKYHLEEARDLAVAQRGMGLGRVNGELFANPRKIKTREGKWLEVVDPSRMYIAQSWVGKGRIRASKPDFKGRGRMGIINRPSTSITLILKEERTRIREHEEREAKKSAKGPWIHLPNRNIYGQRPYYTW